MDASRWRGTAMLLLVLAVAISVAGCGQSGSHPSSVTTTGAAQFTAAQLRSALLARVGGIKAAEPAVTGDYASLAASDPGGHVSRGVHVTPKACADNAPTGFNRTVLAASPAAAVTFRLGRNGVSEMLVSSSAASSALAGQVPAQCARYKETIDGQTFRYAVNEGSVKGVGKEARVLYVRSTNGTAGSMWLLVYRGVGFVGSVTLVGPDATERAVKKIAKQAYAFAARVLA